MPLYMSKDRSSGAVRHFEAPSNRAVLLHLAAEMFDVARVKFEVIAEAATTRGDEELPTADEVRGILTDAAEQPPAPRRGRRPKNPPPEPAAEPAVGEPGAEAAEQPNPSGGAPAASEGLLAAEAERASRVAERMGALGRANQPTQIVAEPVAGAPTSPGTQSRVGDEGEAHHPGSVSPETQEDEQPARPEPMFEE